MRCAGLQKLTTFLNLQILRRVLSSQHSDTAASSETSPSCTCHFSPPGSPAPVVQHAGAVALAAPGGDGAVGVSQDVLVQDELDAAQFSRCTGAWSVHQHVRARVHARLELGED